MTQTGKIAYRGKSNLYLNITNRCSSDCTFCLRTFSDGVYGEPLRLLAEPSIEEVEQAIELASLAAPVDEVVFCGLGEPTMRLDAVIAVTEWLNRRRLPTRLNTNGHGQVLNPQVDVPAVLAQAGLDAISVSLNFAEPEVYDLICRPIFAKTHRAVIRFAEECVQHGIATTITAVDQPQADLAGCEAIACAVGARFRARGLMTAPTDH
ncbi:MAG: TatD family nuclease-associated radical SAM protein [Thermoleophilia bacterium]